MSFSGPSLTLVQVSCVLANDHLKTNDLQSLMTNKKYQLLSSEEKEVVMRLVKEELMINELLANNDMPPIPGLWYTTDG